jgi:hypothetical protein
VGAALYPDDSDTVKLLLAIAEGRKDHRVTGATESLLALNAHHHKETGSPEAADSPTSPHR